MAGSADQGDAVVVVELPQLAVRFEEQWLTLPDDVTGQAFAQAKIALRRADAVVDKIGGLPAG
ncbi:MAG: hypothetical protein A2004_14565 [Spirochaetes bacterium GWC1_61_12]|nr:MAG: hypothetical protein A2004_14565 [Spirochaetes bacterium GWC1_61_12]